MRFTAFVAAAEPTVRAQLAHGLSELSVSCQAFPIVSECLEHLRSASPDLLFVALRPSESWPFELFERVH
jgi:hypothetical protein